MNNPNPFIPQGSLLEQKNKKRTRFQMMVFGIFAVNVLVIAPMLIQGCKRDTSADTSTQTPVDSGTTVTLPTTPDTNLATLPPQTNPVVTQAPPPPVVPTSTGTEYVIAKGDTLDSIHKKFSVSVKAIEDANLGIVPTKLQVGHKIQIPAATAAAPATSNATMAADGSELYVVKTGDSLSKIATDHGTSYKAIMTLNNLTTTKIKVGDKLKMPVGKAASTPPAATVPAPAPAPVTPTPTAPSTPPQ